ncbi:EscN/YscN/HrcN family type III secretion system ATPase [Steroidobacter agaridevorans]|uniref:protein-secreting ATPase n=1 Tax=Steroidobacter agaridevorans TaxID=2695856 RepID=A0A829YHL5_9GAMM|nr:FliI/YscN family ATPase [Steroidobacter agaridevorans]GFE82383.1 EscN/YscN/HrcN family type III secretion system ATPase [Steroidobacter agaridevorans]GFE85228.1 EscN/YscN/HrcN family type III secretion system ATPase [Steroidobacter agaridevorans]
MRIQQQRPNYLADALDDALLDVAPVESRGRVLEALGTVVKATGVQARIGDLCELRSQDSSWRMHARVIGVQRHTTLLMPFGELEGIGVQTEVVHCGTAPSIRVGNSLLGRVVDGFGQPMDGMGPLKDTQEFPVHNRPPNALDRKRIQRSLQTGVRAIDAVLTCGEGQRMGVFAPAGAGKSTLLGMIAQGTAADVTVVGLIGERGREVREFIDIVLAPGRAANTVVVVATSDRPAGERVEAANVATAIAEYFRQQNRSVLLLIDSVTRYARALREIGLAAGEPPTRRGYPPSVFSALPTLVERAGQSANGAITAFYTVLVDDEEGDPIGEELRALLDGHVVLSRELAAADHYPAIDVAASRSRVMSHVTTKEHRKAAGELRELLAKHADIQVLLQIGEYQAGADALADKAIRCKPNITKLLRQQVGERMSLSETIALLRRAAES